MSHEHSQHKNHHHEHKAPKKKLHHDWRFWVVVPAILALISMVIYVATVDEALVPGEPVQEEVPAAAE